MRTLGRWLAGLGLALLLGVGGLAGFDEWWIRKELRAARADLDRGAVARAHRRLAVLSAARPGRIGGAIDYWLGIAESIRGRHEAALEAFARVPGRLRDDPLGVYHEASANLQLGRLRAAEGGLEKAIARGGPGLGEIRALLLRVYLIQLRTADAAALLRDGLDEADDPVRVMRDLFDLGREKLPIDGLALALDQAGRMAPDDDRVWLGKGRLAMHRGRWDEADPWLRRCLDARPDAPAWRARLDWALGSGRPEEALTALRNLDPGDFDPVDRYRLRAWFSERAGDESAERRAWESVLELNPAHPQALDRLAALAHRAGRDDRAAEYRRRKAEVDRAQERYQWRLQDLDALGRSADRLEMGRLAETIGLMVEARTWYALALDATPGLGEAIEALARLDRRRGGGGPGGRPETWDDLAAVVGSLRPDRPAEGRFALDFRDEAEWSGLRFVYENGETSIHQLPETTGGGVAVLDVDGDGWFDVYVVQGGAFPPIEGPNGDRLYRNRGDGTFEDVTASSGIAAMPGGYGHGVAVGDVDNDGHPDLFITRWRSYALYRNRGDGTFEDVTEAAGLGGDRGWPTSAAFADLDGDGDLDLYVCHYVRWDEHDPRLCPGEAPGTYISCNPLELDAEPDRLYRNDGGRFVDVTEEAGIGGAIGRGLGVLATDLDGDGVIDLYVANDLTANLLWRNLGGMRFEEVGHEAGVASNAAGGYQAGMGVAAGDLDGDGLIDLAVTNFFGESTTFYRNLGGGMFNDETASIGLASASRSLLGFGVVFFDADNDGYLDLATANGHVNDLRPLFPYLMPAQLLRGGPGGRLVDVSDRAGSVWRVPRMGRALASGDLDNDGRVDLLLLSHRSPLAFFRNRTAGGHSLTLRLEGVASNRDAVGAEVAVLAGGRRLVSRRIGGGSYQSASDPRLHFGLGDVTTVDELVVTWPSGRTDRHGPVRADRAYLLREGSPTVDPLEPSGPR